MKKIYMYIILILSLLLISLNVFSAFSTITTSTKTVTNLSTWTTTNSWTSIKLTPVTKTIIKTNTTQQSTDTWFIQNINPIKTSSWIMKVNNIDILKTNCEWLGGKWPFPWNSEQDPYKDNKCCAWLKFIYPAVCYKSTEWSTYKELIPWCNTICAKVWDFVCDTKYENYLNSTDCDVNWCGTKKDYVCWVKLLKICILNGWCKIDLKYKTYDNECLLNNNKFNYSLYWKWKCEDIEKWAKKLTVKIKEKLDFVVVNYISRLEQNYYSKNDKIENINTIISKFEELETNNPLYVNITQYIISKLKVHKTKYQNEEDFYIDEVLKIFN
jgi:hypothetical protein